MSMIQTPHVHIKLPAEKGSAEACICGALYLNTKWIEPSMPMSPTKEEINFSNDEPTVNHPPHYGGNITYEAIKVIHAWELDFNLGNVLKYIRRSQSRIPTRGQLSIEDLKKAAFYLDYEIAILEGDKPWEKS